MTSGRLGAAADGALGADCSTPRGLAQAVTASTANIMNVGIRAIFMGIPPSHLHFGQSRALVYDSYKQ
jgi:hypothetical protein